MAQSWRITRFADDGLQLGPAESRAPGCGEVALRMEAASLNARDLAILKGRFGGDLPRIPLSDGAGVVEAVGEGVTGLAPGDRVTSVFFPHWSAGAATAHHLRSSVGLTTDGTLTERAILPATAVLPYPAHLSAAEAATLPCAGLTAWTALFVKGQLKPGQHVLIQGTGGVAIFALQLAKLAGAVTTVITSSAAKAERVKELGADHVIDRVRQPEWAEAVQEITGGLGADIVIELGGGGTLAQSLKAVKVGGHITVIGVLGGASASTSISDILFRHATLHGITVGSLQDAREFYDAVAKTRLHPVIDHGLSFGDAPQAFVHMRAGHHMGKIVIHI